MAEVKMLNMEMLRNRKTKNTTTKQALKDITPFQWNEKEINEKSIVIDRKTDNL